MLAAAAAAAAAVTILAQGRPFDSIVLWSILSKSTLTNIMIIIVIVSSSSSSTSFV